MTTIYHGTNKNFENLDLRYAQTGDYEEYGTAIYFSSNIDVARSYGKNIYALRVDEKKFKTIYGKNKPIRYSVKRVTVGINNKLNLKVVNVVDNTMIGGCVYNHVYGCSAINCKNKKCPAYEIGRYNQKYYIANYLCVFHNEWKGFKNISSKEFIKYCPKNFKETIDRYYEIDGFQKFTNKNLAKKLNKNGIPVYITYRTTPKASTTFIITKQSILDCATLLEKKEIKKTSPCTK